MVVSPLATTTIITQNKSLRTSRIDGVAVHCMAANATIKACGNRFALKSTGASSNYGIASSGEIGCFAGEEYRSYCTSNRAVDNRVITVEVANDGGAPQWHVSDAAIRSLIRLLVDVCKRNKIKKLVWSSKKNDRVNWKNGCNMQVHRDYAKKACPGDYLYSLHPYIAQEVNKQLGVETFQTSFMYRDVDFAPVFDAEYYQNCNPDLVVFGGNVRNLFEHFCLFGMNESRQAKNTFDPHIYRYKNKDLDAAFGDNWYSYYWHYCVVGKTENRVTY